RGDRVALDEPHEIGVGLARGDRPRRSRDLPRECARPSCDARGGGAGDVSVKAAVDRDPLLQFRAEFPILERTTYLVSNSLGAMPGAVPERLAEYVDQWAERGVRAWGGADGWWEMPVSVGDEIAPFIGAPPGSVAMLPNVTIAQASVLSALSYAP